nr:MAG: reverse transcriptase-like protein [Xiaogan botourmia-like virus 2]
MEKLGKRGGVTCPVRSRKRSNRVHTCKKSVDALRANVLRAKQALENAYNVSLPQPSIGKRIDWRRAVIRVKEWIERSSSESSLRKKGMGIRERRGLVLSLKLVKKVFPKPCSCLGMGWEDFKRSQSVEDRPPPSPGFLDFVRRETTKLFRPGWVSQSAWQRAVLNSPPTAAACAELSREKGGLASVFGSYDEYLDCLNNIPRTIVPAKYAEVPTGGKLRRLTMQPSAFSALAPLHKAIYDRLRHTKWLLVGRPTHAKFIRAGFRSESKLLSGDYQSATDGLDLRVTETILDVILSNSGLDRGLQDLARTSIRHTVAHGNDSFRIAKGQMMGFYLSFPLLCLYNRFVSLYALGDVPMLINGDDLVAETRDPDPWFNLLPPLGLVPERTKTDYKSHYCEINSTGFYYSAGEFRECGVQRLRSLRPTGKENLSSLGGRLDQFVEGVYNTRLSEDVWMSNWSGVLFDALRLGVPLRELGFTEKHRGALARAGVVTAAKRYARLYGGPNPVDVRGCGDADPLLVRVRRHCESSKAACVIDAFCHRRSAVMTRNMAGEFLTRKESQGVWDSLRESVPLRPRPIRFSSRLAPGLVINARHQLFFGDLIPGRVFLNRQLAPRASTYHVPAWYLQTIPPTTRRALSSIAFVAELDTSRFASA